MQNKKRVLITGASRGIGKATAAVYEKHGYFITAPSREELSLDNLQSVKQFIEQYESDVFDVIINNAGINDISLVEDVTDEQIENGFNINLIAPIMLLRAFVPAMKKRGFGRIINIGSIWAVVSKQGRLVYSASKNAMHGVTNTLAVELAPNNILVNTVCPGFTLTELTYKNNTEEQLKQIREQIPLDRMAEPEEIAEFVYFFGSEANTYVTGQKLVIDGGFTVR